MKFIRYPQFLKSMPLSVVTIGNFDGVHLGHKALITKVTKYAKQNNLQSIVVSMQPSANHYFNKTNKTSILTPFKYKFKQIEKLNVDVMCVLNFNKNLASLSPEDFIQKNLINGLNAKYIIVGDDFRFGKNRAGNLTILKNYCEPLGISIESIPTISKQGERISSSGIRKSLCVGDFVEVEKILGRKFSISGKVSKGKQLGRTLNFPTINLKLEKTIVPLKGIFCVKVVFSNRETYLGAASLGTRPTINGTTNILEVHILDFNKQVYGQNVEIFFYHKLRNEVKFDTLSDLKRQIAEDVLKTQLFFDKIIN